MVSSSESCSSSDDKNSRKRRKDRKKSPSGDKRGHSYRDGDRNRENYRRSDDVNRYERRNQHHNDTNRQQRKRRLESSPPRRENHRRLKDDEINTKASRDRHYNTKYKQRDDKDRDRSQKTSFEQAKVKKEPSPEWGQSSDKNVKPKPVDKEKPNFELSGKLTEDTNKVNGVVVKYSEPEDAAKPKRRWRLYQFKGEKNLPTLYLHRQSAFLIGRDRKVADIPIDHPSCSKQHAALQFRLVSYIRENNTKGRRVRPYLIDLESANGTYVNDVKLEPRRYHELLERDVIKFGFSTREYVLLHEQSKDDDLDDDVPNLTA